MELDRRHLRHLAAVAFHRSVTQAAAELGITQPALSRSIRETERTLGLRLFDRLPQGVVPTAACLRLLERARPLLGGFDAFEQEAERLGGAMAGELTIGLGPAVSAGSAPLEIAAFVREHRAVRCRVVSASAPELARRMEQLELDFLVADLNALDALAGPFEVDAIGYDATFFCRKGHPVLRSPAALATVAQHPIALLGAPRVAIVAARESLRALDPELPADWEPALLLDDASALASLMLESDVIGGSAAYAHSRALASGRLRALPLPEPAYRGRVGPARLRGRSLSAAGEALWKTLASALRRDLALASR